LKNTPFRPISALGSNFNPQNTQCIPAVKIFAFLELKQNWAFFKGLNSSRMNEVPVISLSTTIDKTRLFKFFDELSYLSGHKKWYHFDTI
jgi:hypothetical protein